MDQVHRLLKLRTRARGGLAQGLKPTKPFQGKPLRPVGLPPSGYVAPPFAVVVAVRQQAPQAEEVVGPREHGDDRSEEHTSELQSRQYLVCRLLLEKKKTMNSTSQSRKRT